jgi:hypothetical protein
MLALALALTTTIASADVANSANWAGYAVHGKGQKFRRVVGSWTIPSGQCVAGQASYSATWVGIGGFSASSTALEQIGTELDCTAGGQPVVSAWGELLPEPAVTLPLTVSPGDAIGASVTVRGQSVTLQLTDMTTKQSFQHAYGMSAPDVTSAEWIVEAPEECSSPTDCWTLPLADFGATRIGLAQAWNTKGHQGGIYDKRWSSTQLQMTPLKGGVSHGTTPTATGKASPSRVTGNGSVFSVLFSVVSGLTNIIN